MLTVIYCFYFAKAFDKLNFVGGELAIFADRLKQLRADKQLSQQRLADMLGMAQSSINQYEHSQSEPDINTLINLSKIFDTSVDYLVGNTSCNASIEKLLAYKVTPAEVRMIDKWRETDPATRDVIELLITTINKQGKGV